MPYVTQLDLIKGLFPLLQFSASFVHHLHDRILNEFGQKKKSPIDQANIMPPAMADNAIYMLWCMVSDEGIPFKIRFPSIDFDIGNLKELIKEKIKNGILDGIDATDLALWKVSTSNIYLCES